MLRRFSVILIIVLISLGFAGRAFAYRDKTTHPALTDEIIDYWNLLNPQRQLTPEEKEWIVLGSVLEDREVRALNHLYDPIYKIGWTGEKIGNVSAETVQDFVSAFAAPAKPTHAVDWANNRILQSRYESYGGDRTWKQALEYWADGNKKEAYITLGHALHLIEDMAVPDHTRNDPHLPFGGEITGDYGSPYEDYAKKWDRGNIHELNIPNS